MLGSLNIVWYVDLYRASAEGDQHVSCSRSLDPLQEHTGEAIPSITRDDCRG